MSNPLARATAQAASQFFIPRQLDHRGSDVAAGLVRIACGDLEAGIRRYLCRRPAKVETDHRQAGGHCLDRGAATEIMKPRVQRDIAFAKAAKHLVPRHPPQELHPVGNPESRCQVFETPPIPTVTDQPVLCIRYIRLREGAQADVKAFQMDKFADADEPKTVFRLARLTPSCSTLIVEQSDL